MERFGLYIMCYQSLPMELSSITDLKVPLRMCLGSVTAHLDREGNGENLKHVSKTHPFLPLLAFH